MFLPNFIKFLLQHETVSGAAQLGLARLCLRIARSRSSLAPPGARSLFDIIYIYFVLLDLAAPWSYATFTAQSTNIVLPLSSPFPPTRRPVCLTADQSEPLPPLRRGPYYYLPSKSNEITA
jgi:hypothetical protein